QRGGLRGGGPRGTGPSGQSSQWPAHPPGRHPRLSQVARARRLVRRLSEQGGGSKGAPVTAGGRCLPHHPPPPRGTRGGAAPGGVMRSSRCALGTAALALAVTTLVGRGGADDSGGTSRPSEGRSQQAANTPLEGLGPDEVRDASIAAMKELTSMRMDATSTQDGQETHFDVFMHVDGHCTGTMGLNGVEGEVRS